MGEQTLSKLGQDVWLHHLNVLQKKRGMRKERRGQKNKQTGERKRGSSMTTKQSRGGPASPSHPPWLHRNTRAMPTLQTHSFPLSSDTLHYPVLSQAQRGTAPLSQHYSRVPAHSLAARLPTDPARIYTAPQASGHNHFICTVQRQHWEVSTCIMWAVGPSLFFFVSHTPHSAVGWTSTL